MSEKSLYKKRFSFTVLSFFVLLISQTLQVSAQDYNSNHPDIDFTRKEFARLEQKYRKTAEESIQKARELELYKDPYWHTLIHYKPLDCGSFYKSLVDDPKFFFAENGKTNPQAELEETIRSFFSMPNEHEKHPTARFPGRYLWLRQKLNLSTSDFPYDGDTEYNDLMSKLVPDSIYLVFASGYMKSPASIFGHTFIIVESKGQPRLLANSISYGAESHGVGGIMYGILGLFGGFYGYYGFTPYYDRIRKYTAIDMRDMWEYKLDFTDEEKDRMLRHIIDMQGIYSRYYFVTENCSYNLLFLIEAAKPETQASSRLSGAVEPIATVKFIHDIGLTNQAVYRPSAYAQIENYKKQLSNKENKFVREVCFGKKTTADYDFSKLPKEKQAAMWDLAALYLQHLLSEEKIALEEYRPRYVAVLSARGKLRKVKSTEIEEIPGAPHISHDSKQIALRAGKSLQGNYAAASWHLTAHNQLENPAGYSENSQLEFFSAEVRRYSDDRWELKKAYFADIISLPASDTYFCNTAFQFVLGAEQNANEKQENELALRLKVCGGYSIKPSEHIQLYMMLGPDSYFNPNYEYKTDLLLGGQAGFITTFGNWKNKMESQLFQSPLDKDHFRAVFSAQEQLNLKRNLSLAASYSFNMDYENRWHDLNFSININY